ncbi:MAG: SIR2 family protein [Acidobacteriota bacterium]
MGAYDATLEQALDLFEGPWSWLADGLARGRYALWLGSAISRRRLPDLGELLRRLLGELGRRRASGDPRCPYDRALGELLDLAGERGVDRAADPRSWPQLDAVVDRLWTRYDEVLGTRLRTDDGTTVADFLELPNLYGDPGMEPDADHRLIALWLEEGVVSELYSGNWDGLVEEAHRRIRGPRSVELQVVARPEDLPDARTGQPVLYKFHGCAVQALAEGDPGQLVATQRGLLGWLLLPEAEPLREAMGHAMRRSPAMFVGLSAQDVNLQGLFRRVASAGSVDRGDDLPRAVFAKPSLERPQMDVLETLHPDAYRVGLDPAALEARAALPLFSQPFFGGFYLWLLLAKARALLDLAREAGEPTGEGELRRRIEGELFHLRRALCLRYDPVEPENRWERLAQELPEGLGRMLGIFQDGEPPGSCAPYRFLTPCHLDRIPREWALRREYFDRLMLVLALLALLARERGWRLDLAPAAGGCHATLDDGHRRSQVFVLQSMGRAAERLRFHHLGGAADPWTVIVYVEGSEPRIRRTAPSRGGLPGRRGTGISSSSPTEIWLTDALADPPFAVSTSSAAAAEALRRRLPPMGGAAPW